MNHNVARTTSKDPDDLAYTIDGQYGSPLQEFMHHWGKNPEAAVPDSPEGLKGHLRKIGGACSDAEWIGERLVGWLDDPALGVNYVIIDAASRADNRLQELADAVHDGNTDHVGSRIEDLGTMLLWVESLARLQVESVQDDDPEFLSGAFLAILNAITYAQERLDFLLYEADLPLD